jgi:hypothetical protein
MTEVRSSSVPVVTLGLSADFLASGEDEQLNLIHEGSTVHRGTRPSDMSLRINQSLWRAVHLTIPKVPPITPNLPNKSDDPSNFGP